jgi:hypothetical protein
MVCLDQVTGERGPFEGGDAAGNRENNTSAHAQSLTVCTIYGYNSV